MAISFKGTLELPRVSIGRRIGALVVAAVLLLAPLFYLGVIGAVLALLVWLPISGASLGLPPIVVGLLVLVCIVVLAALVKPLVEPQVRSVVERAIDLAREPQLRELLKTLSDQIRSPLPQSVHVECSTRLVMLPKQKRLIIGLPLMACLNVPQFAGLVAGQLALFRGGSGCKVTNFIRRINHWLWRCVYGRSRFDQWLTIVAERPHFHPAKLLLPLAGLRLAAQIVLFVPMFIANTIAARVVQRADLDADLIAARLVGVRAFGGLLQRQELIDFTWEGILAELDFLFRDQSLPDSLPEQLALRMSDMTPELHAALAETVHKADERPFDSRLTRPERLAAVASAAPQDGVFDSRLPANSLLKSYNELARKLTWDYYVFRFGPQHLKTAIQPVAAPAAIAR